MRITHHRDGSYSITELTAADMQNLGYAACAAAGSEARAVQSSTHTDDAAWHMDQMNTYDRLRSRFEVATNTSLSGTGAHYLPRGRAMTVRSANPWNSDGPAYVWQDSNAVKVVPRDALGGRGIDA